MHAADGDFVSPRRIRCKQLIPDRPADSIGSNLGQIGQPEVLRSPCGLLHSHFELGLLPDLATSCSPRRPKMSVYDKEGTILNSQMPSAESHRPTGRRWMDDTVIPKRSELDKSRSLCMEMLEHSTGYHNQSQYDKPMLPGERPEHPVCNYGTVESGHKRAFERQFAHTSIAPALAAKAAASKATWGGWGGNSGAPGRSPLRQPWDSVEPELPGGPLRFRAGETARKPMMTGGKADMDESRSLTFHLTNDVLGTQLDQLDLLPRQKKVHQNQPVFRTFAGASANLSLYTGPAGKA